MDAIECLKSRRSIRLYLPGEVDRKTIEDIVDCGRLAATARNVQPWVFIAVTQPETLRKIAEISEHGKFIASVSCCIVVFCEKTRYFLEDGSAATQNILLAARAHGLASCWVAGDKKAYAPDIARLLNVPETHALVSMVAIGHAQDTPNPPKKSLDEVLKWEQF